jgi:tRNA(adenine34) deaminase
MMPMEEHEKYMKHCLQLAEQALKNGDSPVGAIVVLDGTILGEGVESGKSSGDVTNHAEIIAIRNAINNGFRKDLLKAKLYTTHEPCIMCSYVIRHHHIPQIIYGIPVKYIGGYTSSFNILVTEEVPFWGAKPTVTEGICKEACEELNKKFDKAQSNRKAV